MTSDIQNDRLVAQRIEDLCKEFNAYVNLGKRKYTGPSVYFHRKTMDRFEQMGHSVLKAAKDGRFLELLYATLASWGMHRMDKSAEMPDFKFFADNIAGLASEIDTLSSYQITTLLAKDTPHILDKLWLLIDRLPGTTGKSKLVANSKLLHHLLPHLVPPIDGANTTIFFGCKSKLYAEQKKTFDIVFPQMVSIAQKTRGILDTFSYEGFNSSETKVIDNAIIGWRESNKQPAVN